MLDTETKRRNETHAEECLTAEPAQVESAGIKRRESEPEESGVSLPSGRRLRDPFRHVRPKAAGPWPADP